MARRSRMEQKVYQTGGSPWRFLSYGMIFVSCMLLISGLFGPGSAPADLTVVPSFTPAPTVVADVFDETPASRQITVDSGKWYAIQLGIYGSADSADAQAQAYKQRGAAGYVWQEDERYRVLAAVYPLEEDAKAVRQQLREGQNIDSYVYAIESTTLTLRLTGMAGQLDALEAGFEAMKRIPQGIQELSVSLDRQEADVQKVKEGLQKQMEEMSALCRLFRTRFTQPYHHVVLSQLELLESWQERLETLAQSDLSAVAMAGALKHETLRLIQTAQSYYQSIAQ